MDKTAIRNFAIEARKILMKSAIAEAGFYGISKDGVKAPIQKGKDFEVYETLAGTEKRIFGDDIKRRENLANAVREFGFDQVIEETAYTWFNRIIAIRFMEVNNYLPTRVRVLSSETGSSTPDIVTQADTVELNMSMAEVEKIQQSKQDNKYDEAFRLLFIKQCNELNAILPGLFEKTNDYMELLLKISYTGDGVIRMLIDTIPEDNFNVETEGQVEIIGWMYQYYNTELKDDTFAKLKKNVKITKERIPAATQLFTPDWIVRYMVENSLGRVWIEHLRAVDPSVDEKSKAEELGWKYYLPEAEQEENVAAQLVDIRASYKSLTPQDITCIDPCMGSGHILVYMFDVLMDIYRSEGFSEREAVFDILEKNIRGLDIDRRAYQLSYFALMMKARGYNRIFFRGHENLDGERVQAVPQVYAIEESNNVNRSHLEYFGDILVGSEKNTAINQINRLLDQLIDAREYGSALIVQDYDWSLLTNFANSYAISGQMDFGMIGIDFTQKQLLHIINQSKTMSSKYNAVVTNPPYMGMSNANNKLSEYAKKNFPDEKLDLSTIFMTCCKNMLTPNGFMSMINIPVWMFLGSYENLRDKLLSNQNIINMLHLGRGVFGSDFGTTAFVFNNQMIERYIASYKRLFKKQGAVDSVEQKEEWFFSDVTYYSNQDRFRNVPGYPIAYWVSDKFVACFDNIKVGDVAQARLGMATANNDRFLRMWHEVDIKTIGFGIASRELAVESKKKWFPYNKGGDFRKWYGNLNYVVNWEHDGKEIREFKDEKTGRIRSHNYNLDYIFRPGITWTFVSSSKFSSRMFSSGVLCDAVGCGLYCDEDDRLYLEALLSSKVTDYILNVLNPSISYQPGNIGSIPFISELSSRSQIEKMAEECYEICKKDWDDKEQSYDFRQHPLMRGHGKIELFYKQYLENKTTDFERLRELEERMNEIFINLYGLESEISSDVTDDNISIDIEDEVTSIKSLISYSVGCMFGRYSLDMEGICCASNSLNPEKYKRFLPNEDNIIPITTETYFDDDIVSLFEKWLRTAFGDGDYDENLKYIAKVLGSSEDDAKNVLRKYFVEEFYKDHCNAYSITGSGKRPVYWMFDSGKQNGFKCLIYIHRYDKDTVGRIRSDYLIKTQEAIEIALKNSEYVIKTSSSAVDKAQATRKRDKYIKQLNEIRTYYGALTHIALQKIELDVDRGVKSNYELFQNIEVSNEGEKKQKINLLAKI